MTTDDQKKLLNTEDPIALHAAGFDGYRVMLSRVCGALANDCADVRDLAQRAAPGTIPEA